MKKTNLILLVMWYLLSANATFAYTHADTLRGSNGRGRNWWDVQKYYLQVKNFDTSAKSITGVVQISFNITATPHDSLQLDLQEPMIVDKIYGDGIDYSFSKEGNIWWVKHPFHTWKTGTSHQITISYHGVPRAAVNPPWDGGISWKHDSTGKPWIAVSCQGLGASIWWPCKDAQWDEPDSGMELYFFVPKELKCVSNGRLVDNQMISGSVPDKSAKDMVWHWQVKNPINNYDATFYIGDYVHWHDTLQGEKGVLDLDYWVLRYNEERATKQFAVVRPMIHCFEYWMGPYPFYEDGYKLVDAPYLGMEHQGAVAYGNHYQMGYLGSDRSFSGYGKNFDYIIVHESGHEWFGNNITATDIADNWIHEGITTYSEALFVECLLGKEKAGKYARGERLNIRNDKPIISPYGVNEEGSEDMYDKGSAIMYMIRVLTKDDEKFRMMLRGLGKEFYHQTVTTKQVETYIAKHTELNLTAFFDQYLRTTDIPQLEYAIKDNELSYKFNNIVEGFTLPIIVTAGETTATISPTGEWQHIKWKGGFEVKFGNDFLMKVKK